MIAIAVQLAQVLLLLLALPASVTAQDQPLDSDPLVASHEGEHRQHWQSDFSSLSSPGDAGVFFGHLLSTRQNQGVGGDASTQPPGVPFVHERPFADNR